MKTLHIVFFLTGLGGNIIRFLCSLDKSTYPIHPLNEPYDKDYDRPKLYSYKNLFWKHGSWIRFENYFLGHIQDPFTHFLKQDKFQIMTLHLHPGKMTFHYEDSIAAWDKFKEVHEETLKEVNVTYSLVDISPKYQKYTDWFLDSAKSTKLVQPAHMIDIDAYEKLKVDLNPYRINFDNFIISEQTFLEEYKKLCEHLKLPVNEEDALRVYRPWRSTRRIDEWFSLQK